MMLVLAILGVSVLIELLLPFVPQNQHILKHVLAAVVAGLLVATSLYIGVAYSVLCAVLLLVLSMYRVFNGMRAVQARMNRQYLRRVCLRTTLWISMGQLFGLFVAQLLTMVIVSTTALVVGGIVFSVLSSAILLMTARGNIRLSAKFAEPTPLAASIWPTVTVAISARNETDSLMACIESVLASDYPKLEILVLDDCSQLRRTAEIIRGFAHAGVRFIPGDEPKQNWLARNRAYDALLHASSGSYMLYCNASVRVEPDTVRRLVASAVSGNRTMVSVMPRFSMSARQISLIEPMRAAWELLVPRRLFGRPPVFSSCWLIETSTLRKLGGFDAVSRMVTPEAYFGRETNAQANYEFVADGERYGVRGESTIDEQRSTGIRTSYPALHRRPENVAAVSIVLVMAILAPFLLIDFGVTGDMSASVRLLSLTSGVASLGLMFIAYRLVLRVVYSNSKLTHVGSFPVAVLAAIGLLHYSMYKYEFSEVIWKERNICVPVMHVAPSLPEA